MKVNFYATLREIVGGKTVEFPEAEAVTAQELLDAMIQRFPALRHELLTEEGRLHGHVHFFINGRDVQFLQDDLETRLTAEDTVNVFPAVGGG
jgi:molybdopterin synthase sulfur carrier subunit